MNLSQRSIKLQTSLVGWTDINLVPSGKSKSKADLVNIPASLYYIKIIDTQDNSFIVYKVGYTATSISARIGRILKDRPRLRATLIAQVDFTNGYHAFAFEQEIHLRNKISKYTNETTILNNGNSELYTTDILNLDYDVEEEFIQSSVSIKKQLVEKSQQKKAAKVALSKLQQELEHYIVARISPVHYTTEYVSKLITEYAAFESEWKKAFPK